MIPSEKNPDPLAELLSALLDDNLTDEQRQKLADLLKADANARERYLDFMLLDSLLQEELGEESLVGMVDMMGEGTGSDQDAITFPAERANATSRIPRVALLLAGCAIVVALGILVNQVFFQSVAPSPPPNIFENVPVASRARLVEREGQVELLTSTGAIRTIEVGEEIEPGQSLRTVGDSSYTVIDYGNVGRFEMNPSTQVRLVKDDNAANPKKIFLSHGVLRTETKGEGEKPFVVATAHAEIQGKNSQFTCLSLPETTWIEVEQGQADVIRQADGRPMSVASGFKTVISIDPNMPKSVAVPVTRQRPEFQLKGPSRSVAFTEDGQRLLLAGVGKVWEYDLATRKEHLILDDKALVTDRTLLSANACKVAFGLASVIHLRDVPDGPMTSIETRLKNVRAFSVAPNGRRLAMIYQPARDPRLVRIWNAITGVEEFDLPSPLPVLGTLAFSTDGQLLAAGNSRGGVVLWDLQGPKEAARWEGMSGSVEMLLFSPDQKQLVAVVGSQLIFWDVASKQQQRRIIEPGLVFRSVAFDPQGKTLAAGTASGELFVWSVETWAKIAGFKADNRPITALAFSHDGQRIATATTRPIRIWRVTGEFAARSENR